MRVGDRIMVKRSEFRYEYEEGDIMTIIKIDMSRSKEDGRIFQVSHVDKTKNKSGYTYSCISPDECYPLVTSRQIVDILNTEI